MLAGIRELSCLQYRLWRASEQDRKIHGFFCLYNTKPRRSGFFFVVRCVGYAIRHILLSGFVISFAVKTIFSDTIQLLSFIALRDRSTSPRDRRRVEEPSHTLQFVLCRVPGGTPVYRLSYHGTARTLSSRTVLCKVSSLLGRDMIAV